MFRNVYYLAFFILLFSSCEFYTKKVYITTLDTFIIETNNNYKDFTNQDWNEADSLYSNFQDDYSEIRSELSNEESTRVNKLLGRYQAIRIKSQINNVKYDMDDMMQQANSFIKEITSDSTLIK
jgi:type I restriction-modification system DNA methylase subunit